MDPKLVTTAFTLDGYRIVRTLGVVRGITVRSRNITLLQELCERARQEAFLVMMEHATQHGANAVVGMRYDATEIMSGVTEVLAYGTAVVVEKL